MEELFVRLVGSNPIVQGFVGGVIIALLNTLGAFLILVYPNPSDRALDAAMGFAAGVMLSAAYTSLIIPGIEHPEYGGLLPVVVGFALGVAVLNRGDAWVPHMEWILTGRGASTSEAERARIGPVLLFIVAITLHNMPEGLAVGVGFGSGNLGDALALMLAIGIQNIPEGLAVSVAAVNAGFDRTFYATVAGVRAGAVEIPLAVFGAFAVQVAGPLLPYAMGFAAGGMLYVIVDEIVPETHAHGNEELATLGTMLGVVLMLSLDVALG